MMILHISDSNPKPRGQQSC